MEERRGEKREDRKMRDIEGMGGKTKKNTCAYCGLKKERSKRQGMKQMSSEEHNTTQFWRNISCVCMARHGTAQHGTARHGTARHGTARHLHGCSSSFSFFADGKVTDSWFRLLVF